MACRQLEGAGDMIAVFVGNEDAGQSLRRQAKTVQLECDLARTEAAVEKEAGCPRLDNQRVATAAAAQRSKAHYFNWS